MEPDKGDQAEQQNGEDGNVCEEAPVSFDDLCGALSQLGTYHDLGPVRCLEESEPHHDSQQDQSDAQDNAKW